MVYKLCNAESAIATCDSYNFNPKLTRKNRHHHHRKLRRFTYAELETATNDFSPNTLLGKGSHGSVYRAVLDGGSLLAAVKCHTSSYTVANDNEISILRKINNHRIVNLIGYTGRTGSTRVPDPSTNYNKLLLVVEYMPNGTLYDLIHTNPKPPTFQTRVRIALQISKAIRTLHLSDPQVIHRDIKSSNVLLDGKHNARLSDFGLALCGHVDEVRLTSTPPAGTLGYLDPYYLTPADVSAKSDVFSFGILLLEIISGRCAIDVNYSPPGIVEWALPLINSGDYRGICDRRIRCVVDRTVIRELAILAVRCVRSTAEKRPHITEVADCIKLVYKRMQLFPNVPIWDNIRRRVRHENKSQPLIEPKESKKVSNVSNPEDIVGEITTRVEYQRRVSKSKSKSVGSFREIKVGPEEGNCEISVDNNNNSLVKRKGQVSVKLSSVVRLSKSRSMSVLQSSKNGSYHGKCLVNNPEKVKELDVYPLLVEFTSSNSSSSKEVESA